MSWQVALEAASSPLRKGWFRKSWQGAGGDEKLTSRVVDLRHCELLNNLCQKPTPPLNLRFDEPGGAFVSRWLSICLQLRSWSWGPGMESCTRLPAGSLLLLLSMSLPLSVCLSWINKILKKKKKISWTRKLSWLFKVYRLGFWYQKTWEWINSSHNSSVGSRGRGVKPLL